MREGWISNIRDVVIVTLTVWLGLFVLAAGKIIYEDYNELTSLRNINQQLRASNGQLIKERDQLQEKLKEQPKVVYRESKIPTQPSRPVEPTKINNLLVEARVICSLRDPVKLPNNIAMSIFDEMSSLTSFFEGPMGKAYLRPITSVSFQRMEERSKAFTVLRYELPNNSDLIGEPVSSLSRYVTMVINLWAIHYDDFTECGFLEMTLRVNGIDVLRRSLTIRLVLDVPDKTKWVGIPLKEMKLPQ